MFIIIVNLQINIIKKTMCTYIFKGLLSSRARTLVLCDTVLTSWQCPVFICQSVDSGLHSHKPVCRVFQGIMITLSTITWWPHHDTLKTLS
jgi:hypothetical protein